MRRFVPLLGLGIVACWVGLAPAQNDDVQGTLEKAIKAQGGEKLLQSVKLIHLNGKGTASVMGNDFPFTAENFVDLAGKVKVTLQLEVQNMNLTIIQVFDGKQAWISLGGMTMELEKAKVDEFRHGLHVENVSRLVPLREKGYKLSSLGTVKVDGKDAVGIQVVKEGQRDVNLYFDKTSFLLVKAEYRSMDPTGNQEVNQAKYFSGYKEFAGGLKVPTKILVTNDDKKLVEMEVTDYRLVDRLDPSVFAKP